MNPIIHYLRTKDEENLLSFQVFNETNPHIQIRQYYMEGGNWIEDEEFLHERFSNGYWSVDQAREKYKEYVREGWNEVGVTFDTKGLLEKIL